MNAVKFGELLCYAYHNNDNAEPSHSNMEGVET